MNEKQSAKSRKKQSVFRTRLMKWWKDFAPRLTWRQAAVGLGTSFLISLLLLGYQFQEVPDYQLGDIADRKIEAPVDFPVSDVDSTRRRQDEFIKTVPVVFSFDPRVYSRLESEVRSGFGHGRRRLAEQRQSLSLEKPAPLPPSIRQQLAKELKEALPTFDRGRLVEILIRQEFSSELEDQMLRILRLAMKEPGVVASRDLLLFYQYRPIILLNTLGRKEEILQDWMSIRDLGQARDLLRQNEYELTVASGEEKREIINFLDNLVLPNVEFNELETDARTGEALENVAPVLIQIKKGRTIVRAGDEVGPQEVMVLNELRKLRQGRQPSDRFAGIFLIVIFFMVALWQYFLVYQKRHQKIHTDYLLVSLVLLISLVLAKLCFSLADLVAGSLAIDYLRNSLHFYFAAPLALGAILLILLVGVQLCILYTLIFSVFIALMTGQPTMAIYAVMGSMAAIYALRHYGERSAIVRAGMVIGLVNILTAFSLQLYSSGFQWVTFGIRGLGGLVAGSLAAMLASLLLPVLESLFEVTTDIRLVELSNLNKPILRRLAVEAPGTYHHSIIVGTLAESAAEAIGANPLLVRVGAYYHDIGKLRKPEYYVENQIYMANKHEGLTPNMSSLILASHVKEGLVLAREINLAPKVRDLIPEHHGTKLMTYFYQKAKQASSEKNSDVNEEDFRYPGPKPQSKEGAILMLADQVEAASRTLQEPTPGQIRSLIKRLIQSTIQDGQFDECDITTRDLNEISKAFEHVISGMYHHRIEYPGFNFNKQVADKQTPNQHIQ